MKVIFDIADKQRVELETTAKASIAEKHAKENRNSSLESECASLKRKYEQMRTTAGIICLHIIRNLEIMHD